MRSQIGYKGEIAILSAAATATNQNAWIKVMEETLKDPKYKDMKLVTTVYGDDDPTKSTTEAQGLLQAYPDLKCIIAPTTVGIAAAAQVVTQQKKCDKVIVTGLGLPSEMREFVKSGCVKQNALWNFEDIGYLAAYAAHAVLAGDITGAEGETFDAGRLGQITVGADGDRLRSGAPRLHKGQHRRLRLLDRWAGERRELKPLPPLHRFG